MKDAQRIAVAVSGGPDSMALCSMLSALYPDTEIYALTVDHGLRTESSQEAQDVGDALSSLGNVAHHILTWEHDKKPDARIQERAREVRYGFMREFMAAHKIGFLFLGHHMDDQAETFLFRLAKGSGLDGLSGMPFKQDMGKGFVLCRPFLSFLKTEILEYCKNTSISCVEDPSNESEKFARVRLRKSKEVLEGEGLSAKRLSVTAKRMERAREALELIAKKYLEDNVLESESSRLVLKILLLDEPEEIVLRVLINAILILLPELGHSIRMEKLENLCADLMKPDVFRKRTLGGIVFERNDKDQEIVLSLEK